MKKSKHFKVIEPSSKRQEMVYLILILSHVILVIYALLYNICTYITIDDCWYIYVRCLELYYDFAGKLSISILQ